MSRIAAIGIDAGSTTCKLVAVDERGLADELWDPTREVQRTVECVEVPGRRALAQCAALFADDDGIGSRAVAKLDARRPNPEVSVW